MDMTLRLYAGNKRGISDGIAFQACFDSPTCVASSSNGDVWIVDQGNVRIRKMVDDTLVSSLTGTRSAPFQVSMNATATATASTDTFNSPIHLSVNETGDAFVADQGGNRIRKMTGGQVYTVVQQGLKSYREGCDWTLVRPNAVRIDSLGDLWIANTGAKSILHVVNIAEQRQVNTALLDWANKQIVDGLEQPLDFAFSPLFLGHALIADSHRIKLLRRSDHRVDIYAGQEEQGYLDGWRGVAKFGQCRYLLMAPNSDLLVSDMINHCIRRISVTGMVTTFVGSPASSSLVKNPTINSPLSAPGAMCWTRDGDLIIPDTALHHLFVIDQAQVPPLARVNLAASFELGLKITNKTLTHKSSGISWPVLEPLIALASFNVLDVDSVLTYLQDCTYAPEAIETFLHLIAGEYPTVYSTDIALETLVRAHPS